MSCCEDTACDSHRAPKAAMKRSFGGGVPRHKLVPAAHADREFVADEQAKQAERAHICEEDWAESTGLAPKVCRRPPKAAATVPDTASMDVESFCCGVGDQVDDCYQREPDELNRLGPSRTIWGIFKVRPARHL